MALSDCCKVVGSTNLRYADLIAGHLPNGTADYATILTYPFTSESQFVSTAQRANTLARVSDFVQAFSSSAFTVSDASLTNATERVRVRSFLAAMYAANQFLAKPKNKKCSVTAIARQLNVTREVAAAAYSSAIDPLTGETSSPGGNFTFNRQGVLNVIDVRSQFGGFAKVPAGFDYADDILPGRGKLVDYSVRDEAVEAVVKFHPSC